MKRRRRGVFRAGDPVSQQLARGLGRALLELQRAEQLVGQGIVGREGHGPFEPGATAVPLAGLVGDHAEMTKAPRIVTARIQVFHPRIIRLAKPAGFAPEPAVEVG